MKIRDNNRQLMVTPFYRFIKEKLKLIKLKLLFLTRRNGFIVVMTEYLDLE